MTRTPTNPDLAITAAVRPSGTPTLQDALPKALAVSETGTAALLDELHTILTTIPTESPPGSEDIYKLDTSIAYGSEELQWMNGGPRGCGGGTSSVQPTAEDKAKFARAVEIVHKLVEEAK